ncbi:N-acetylmuramoyl-L-alanine amidase [Amycolatopsis sp. VS8301801F10]|uniref:N-acetylmuramoyl-L-alanine amidase n=1 Tax=Amycolatopsis sp. VS8301801F10 TaxID=2652442 RepID=UPI0038FC7BEA
MYLTALATIARSAGLRVVEQPGWTTRGHGQMSGVKAVVCHHTAGPAAGNAPSIRVVQNGRADLAGPLAHYVLGRDGTVYVVAAGLCWHAGAVLNNAWSNNYSIGIEAEATGTAAWPEEQLDAYARLCRALCTAYGLPVSAVLGHKEVCSPRGRKSDPNFDMGAFRARIAALGTAPAGGGNTGGSAPQNQEDDMPDRELRPSANGSVTMTVPPDADELVIGVGWTSMTVTKVGFFGPTPGDRPDSNQLWATSGSQRVDAARPWRLKAELASARAKGEVLLCEVDYVLAPVVGRDVTGTAGFRKAAA